MPARCLRGILKRLAQGGYQRGAGQRLLNLFAAEKRNHGGGSVEVDARDYAIIAATSNAGDLQSGTWDNQQRFISLLQELTRHHVKNSETFFSLAPAHLVVDADCWLSRARNQ